MNVFLNFFSEHIGYWPLVVFTLLMLSGLNFPISEDALIILSAGVCNEDTSILIPTIIALYLGIVLSDSVSYFLGYLCSKGLNRSRRVRKLLNSHKKDVILEKIANHGFLTFITFRFIPFGVRNLVFLTSGFFRLKFFSFMVFDFTAAVISSMTLFWLTFLIGSDAHLYIRILGGVLLLFVAAFVAYNIIKIRRDFANNSSE